MKLIACLFPLALLATPALAQSQAEFVSAFSGKWQVYDQHLATGDALCRLDFSGTATDGKMPLTATGCAAPLAGVKTWSIEGSQLVLADADGKAVVKLGGNQKRVTGATDAGQPIILERAGGDGSAATLQAAYNASGCYFLGYTQKCAPRDQLGVPAPGPDGRIQIELQTNLAVHGEPRVDADTVGTAQQGTCIKVDTCTMASDGPWCRAKFGDVTGWMRKLSLRQNRWPVVTYTTSSTKSAGSAALAAGRPPTRRRFAASTAPRRGR
jgi:hypothetical protein